MASNTKFALAVTVMPLAVISRSEEHTSELQSRQYLVCRLLLEKKKKYKNYTENQITICAITKKQICSNPSSHSLLHTHYHTHATQVSITINEYSHNY